jgi:Flp pilus assembly protein TadD
MSTQPTPDAALEPVERTLERARSMLRSGHPKHALAALLPAVERHPSNAELWRLAGSALLEAGDAVQAEAALRNAVQLAPEVAGSWVELGRVQSLRGVRDEPLRCWRQALALDPDEVDALVRLGSALAAQGQLQEAGEHLARALQLAPADPGVVAGVASWLLLRGDASDSWSMCDSYRGTDARVALISASSGIRVGKAREALIRVDRALETASTAARTALLYSRGDLLDALGREALAVTAWTQANESRGLQFDPVAHREATDQRIVATTGRRWPEGPHPGASRVVLVVGPPRTGSSVLEQALSRHPAIAAGGELEALRDIGVSIRNDPQQDAEQLARRYLAVLDEIDPHAQRVTDKMPNNLFLLGLLAKILPGSRVIRCVRDPADTAFSCFRQPFGPGHPWATRWEWIRAWLSDAERLMDHWERELPLKFHTVRYEELAREPERVLRGVVSFLDLPWDDAVLSPERSTRVIATASQLEVKEAIHARSVGRAERYARWLTPS